MKLLPRLLAGSVWSATALGASLILPLATPSVAQAQIRMAGGPRGGMGSEISRKSLDQYARVLSLDAAQKEAAAQLHAGYLESMKQVSTEMEESMRSLRDDAADGDASGLMEKLPEIMRKSGERRDKIQKGFLDDLRTLLTPQQDQNWPSLERLRRRESGLRSGMVSGAGVDMVSLVDSLKLPAEESKRVAEGLAQYETDLDRLLVDHQKDMDGLEAKGPKEGPMHFDMESIRARMDKARETGIKVRDLNRQYERTLGAQLSEAFRPQLSAEFKKRAFRQIYRDSTPSRWLAAADKFDDLDAQQRQALNDLKDSYGREVSALNDRWAAALEQAETEGKAGGLGLMLGGGGESEELAAARKARRELDERTSERIRTALNEKQRERLPKKRPAGDASGNFVTAGAGGAMVFQSIQVDDGEDGEEGTVTNEVHVIAPR